MPGGAPACGANPTDAVLPSARKFSRDPSGQFFRQHLRPNVMEPNQIGPAIVSLKERAVALRGYL